MTWRISKSRTLPLLAAAALACGLLGQPSQASTQSSKVAYINSMTVANGGSFPDASNPAFSAFSFFLLPYNNASFATALAPGGICGATACDTVLLNVASPVPFRCSANALLGAAQKADLLSFVSNGGKLIIYDSECSAQNYSWLPYPFTTNNPGAQGARGTANIVEDNALSSPIVADPQYINAVLLATGTDAIGDMNVMTTQHPNWCLDISGTNINQVTGPVHTYARYGNGLIIYNGMDVDFLGVSTSPTATTGAGNLSKIWLQELQVAFNPTPLADLPCGVAVIGISLTPLTATNDLSLFQNTHTVAGTLKDQTGAPVPGKLMTFTITSGPNVGTTATGTTSASGQVIFTYSSTTTGTDTIQVCTPITGAPDLCSQPVTKVWVAGAALVCDVDADGDIDKADLSVISRARGQTVRPGDPRDSDGDGLITPNDVKVCIPLCTRAGCAIQ